MARFGRSYTRLGLIRPVRVDGINNLAGDDSAVGVDAALIAAALGSVDTSTATDSQSLVVQVASSDSGTGIDAVVRIAFTAPDTATGIDAASIAASLPGSDTGTGSDTAGLAQSAGDTGTGTDASSIAATLSSNDARTLTDAGTVQQDGNPVSSDTGSGTDNGSLTANVPGSDTLTGTDTGSISQTRTESGTATDAGTVSVQASSADTASIADAGSLVVSVSSSDTGSLTDYGTTDAPPPPPPPKDFSAALVMGPATIYVGEYGSPEPADSLVASVPSATYWTDLGGTLDGVTITIKREYESVDLMQIPDRPMSRLVKEELRASSKVAEPTLRNFQFIMNEGEVATGSGYSTFTPAATFDEATPLDYTTVIIDGWAPELTNGRHKRRRVIMRKCLSIEGTVLNYSKDKQTTQEVTWSTHRVDGVTAPFKIIDEA